MKDVFELDDDELEACVDGTTNIDMLREILEKDGTVDSDGYVDIDSFAQWFAYALEGFIDADEDTEEWDEAYENNRQWGEDIAVAINDYLVEDGV